MDTSESLSISSPPRLSPEEIRQLEQRLHDLQRTLRRTTRQRALLLSRVEQALGQSTQTSTVGTAPSEEARGTPPLPAVSLSATHAVRARAAAHRHRAAVTSLTVELAQLWQALVLPWFEATVVPFAASVEARLSTLHARLAHCDRRLDPHRRQYRWREGSGLTTTTASGASEARPRALAWYLRALNMSSTSTLALPSPPRSGPTLPSVATQLHAQAQTVTASFLHASAPLPAEVNPPRSLAHLLRVWHCVLPPVPSPSRADAADDPTPDWLLDLAKSWADALLNESAEGTTAPIALLSAGAPHDGDDDGEASLQTLQWLLRDASAAMTSTASDADLPCTVHDALGRLLGVCGPGCLAVALPPPPDNSTPPKALAMIPPPVLTAIYKHSRALLEALPVSPPDTIPTTEVATTATNEKLLAALHNVVGCVRTPSATEDGDVDAYRACAALVQASFHACRTHHRAACLRERLAGLRECEAQHRRFLQQSEAQWQEAKARATCAARAMAATNPSWAHHSDEELASVCPLRLVLDPRPS